jgi:hypothetical protein
MRMRVDHARHAGEPREIDGRISLRQNAVWHDAQNTAAFDHDHRAVHHAMPVPQFPEFDRGRGICCRGGKECGNENRQPDHGDFRSN